MESVLRYNLHEKNLSVWQSLTFWNKSNNIVSDNQDKEPLWTIKNYCLTLINDWRITSSLCYYSASYYTLIGFIEWSRKIYKAFFKSHTANRVTAWCVLFLSIWLSELLLSQVRRKWITKSYLLSHAAPDMYNNVLFWIGWNLLNIWT